MARETLEVQEVGLDGLELTTQAATAEGCAIPAAAGDETILYVNNGSGADVTVTLVATGYAYGVPLEDVEIEVTAGEARYISKMHPAAFGQSTGLIHVNYSAHTDVTVAAFKVAP